MEEQCCHSQRSRKQQKLQDEAEPGFYCGGPFKYRTALGAFLLWPNMMRKKALDSELVPAPTRLRGVLRKKGRGRAGSSEKACRHLRLTRRIRKGGSFWSPAVLQSRETRRFATVPGNIIFRCLVRRRRI